MALTLTHQTIDRLRDDRLARFFTKTVESVRPHLSGYLPPDLDVSVVVTIADSEHLRSLGLCPDVLGIFFTLAEVEEPVAAEDSGDVIEYDVFHNLPDGFEVIINVPEHRSFIHSQMTDDEVVSLLSTVPHEIIHALTFAIASSGKTPLELYGKAGVAGISEISEKIEDRFGSLDDEEVMTERLGLAIAGRIMTHDLRWEIEQAREVEIEESVPLPPRKAPSPSF